MQILKIKLQNWQKHENLELDFSKDLNVITGLSNMGKSCIRRAVDWICFNVNISESDYRREGSKETNVTIWLDSGFKIERVRSDSVNRYILSKEGFEDKIFDSVGREIPAEILQVLEVKPIEIDGISLNLNIAEQLTLPFLLDKPASFRAKLFNKLTGNELLDRLFKYLNKESLRINKEIKVTDTLIGEQKLNLETYSKQFGALSVKLSNAKAVYFELQNNVAYYEELASLSKKVSENNRVSQETKDKLNKIVIVSEETINRAKSDALKYEQLIACQDKLNSIANNLKAINEQQKYLIVPDGVNFELLKEQNEKLQSISELKQHLIRIYDNANTVQLAKERIKVPEIHFEDLTKQIASLHAMEQLIYSMGQLSIQIKNNQDKVVYTNKELEDKEKELQEIWKECPACPLCGKEK